MACVRRLLLLPDAGRVVFSEQSGFGNGEVQVTAHESTSALSGLDVPAMLRERLGEDALEWLEVDKARLEWRVLRCGRVDRSASICGLKGVGRVGRGQVQA